MLLQDLFECRWETLLPVGWARYGMEAINMKLSHHDLISNTKTQHENKRLNLRNFNMKLSQSEHTNVVFSSCT